MASVVDLTQEEFIMKIEIIPRATARALLRIEKMSEKIENEVLDVLHSLKDDDVAAITVEEGEELNTMRLFVKSLVKIEGMNIAIRALEKKNKIVMWKRK